MEKLFFNLFLVVCGIFISNVAVAQFGGNPLSQAVDNTAFDFITETPPVFAQTQVSNFDRNAVQMANIGNNGVTVMATFVPIVGCAN